MKKGFTLVEIMIVVAIIGLLAAIAIPSFMRARVTSQQNACINNLRQIEAAKDQYALEQGMTNNQAIAAGVSADIFNILVSSATGTNAGGYIKAFPTCPSTTRTNDVNGSVASYIVNPIGSNAACLKVTGGSNPHMLK